MFVFKKYCVFTQLLIGSPVLFFLMPCINFNLIYLILSVYIDFSLVLVSRLYSVHDIDCRG